MKSFLVLGAGKSSVFLIERLNSYVIPLGGRVTVADLNARLLEERCQGLEGVRPFVLEGADPEYRKTLIETHDVVVSLLPPEAHAGVALQCLAAGRHLVTASYVSEAMDKLHSEAEAAGLIFLNECGLDPGIDHISALILRDKVRAAGGRITGFISACGGLVARASDNQPWGYKLSWNPRNVVLAGQGGSALYLENGHVRLCPPHRLFELSHPLTLPDGEVFDMYANRDSLSYVALYDLTECSTFIRGTLRRRPFCQAWHALVYAGFTDHSVRLPQLEGKPRKELALALGIRHPEDLFKGAGDPNPEVRSALEYLDLFSEEPLNYRLEPTAAGYLQDILEHKWRLEPQDRDRIVLVHQMDYAVEGRRRRHISWLSEEGQDAVHTAMARTVGLPLAEAAILTAENRIGQRGVLRPVVPEIYRPLWRVLTEKYHLSFQEMDTAME
ncbi:MAG: saccharopine dehydrogenase NADP-binding domain-containing protein [Flavobacteriales bacterium]|nr:saccharopine dehydrogenase NADP-binding domain-containing protein [Flavobacteriales bacterium]